MTHGRGAWPVSGAGGTKKYKDATQPGPYYYRGSGALPASGERTADQFAVFRAVIAYQRALNRRLHLGLKTDGLYGVATFNAVLTFQKLTPNLTTPWGGIGPQTSELLLRPDLETAVREWDGNPLISVKVISGTIRHESLFDAGAVGYLDPQDLGLAQINSGAHPDYTRAQMFSPMFAFDFILGYYENALNAFGNLRDAVASYNLGLAGARNWISAGRPDVWTPPGSSTPREVKAYIDGILAG